MTIIQSIILGLVQGIAEFLPISSSGHLALMQSMFKDFEQPGVLFDTLLHLATLLAVFIFFRRQIWRLIVGFFGIFIPSYRINYYEEKPMIWGIIIATIPTGIIGFLLKDFAEGLFHNTTIIGYMLIITSVILVLSDKFRGTADISTGKALFVGIIQGIVVIPGISRSGSTIFAGLLGGMSRERAAEFSFLISIPAIIGATILQIPHLGALNLDDLTIYLIGMVTAFISGLFAIGCMMRVVKNAKLSYFALYCLLVGIAAIVLL